ncbi:ankyrin repeat domain-containing protein [Aspergillus ibericus CBS 121593]|uniref:Hspc200 n=1 Tax=Aspergillus ibericus CBS 121593 TaxID=1448316 RepID=A0A395GPP2_9EURO|nr:hspc200 [Aspergillus ibericus CBS 121593]RAK97334.1 hspc200 [Aspergillus ibericus CBS 121593]
MDAPSVPGLVPPPSRDWSYVFPLRTSRELLEKARELCCSGDIYQFRELLDWGASFSEDFSIDDFGWVMTKAIEQDNAPVVKELLHRNFPLSPVYAWDAATHKSKKALAVLIEKGWNINQPMGETQPPTLGRVIHDEEMTTWFLDNGADPNARTVMDVTPLSWAVEGAPMSIVRLMVDRCKSFQNGQLLHYAVGRESDTIEVLELLMEKGAPLNAPMHIDHATFSLQCFMPLGTALHRAVELDKVDVVRYLVSKGADQSVKDAKDAKGLTPIELARKLNKLEIIALLEKGE